VQSTAHVPFAEPPVHAPSQVPLHVVPVVVVATPLIVHVPAQVPLQVPEKPLLQPASQMPIQPPVHVPVQNAGAAQGPPLAGCAHVPEHVPVHVALGSVMLQFASQFPAQLTSRPVEHLAVRSHDAAARQVASQLASPPVSTWQAYWGATINPCPENPGMLNPGTLTTVRVPLEISLAIYVSSALHSANALVCEVLELPTALLIDVQISSHSVAIADVSELSELSALLKVRTDTS
jgi:hypothetical protein